MDFYLKKKKNIFFGRRGRDEEEDTEKKEIAVFPSGFLFNIFFFCSPRFTVNRIRYFSCFVSLSLSLSLHNIRSFVSLFVYSLHLFRHFSCYLLARWVSCDCSLCVCDWMESNSPRTVQDFLLPSWRPCWLIRLFLSFIFSFYRKSEFETE